MDAFADLLRGIRSETVVLGQEVLAPPFSVEFAGGAALTLCLPLRGEGWITTGGEARRLTPGDAALVRGPEPFTFTDDPAQPGRPAQVVCSADTAAARMIGPRTCGEALDGPTALAIAEFTLRGEAGARLLAGLPTLAAVHCSGDGAQVLEFLSAEIAADRPGQQIVLERLMDWQLVCTLRYWFDSEEARAPAWYRALADPAAGPAVQAMHTAPHRPWTVAALAEEAGLSRAAFAKRFTEVLGEPPLTYLTRWRMTLAADLLAEPGATVAEVARRVGYSDAFGFSAAYKRIRGKNPSAERGAGRTAGRVAQGAAPAGR